ncbi:MAG: hypothetical protein U0164_13240 [Gemmatimonadaceae bacterium]
MANETPSGASMSDRLTRWIGITGSLVTVVLTGWNAYTKTQIDQREAALKSLELSLKERSAGLEESRERVDRYKWVLGLFPDLVATDERKRNFTVSLIRLALTKDEAAQMFTGLQASSDTGLRAIGQSTVAAIAAEPIAELVAQMNADTPEARKRAVAELERRYASSSQAITLTLRTFDVDMIGRLSPSAVINGLYFLANTEPAAWTSAQVASARQAMARIEGRGAGAQTSAALGQLRTRLAQVAASRDQSP